MIHMKESALLLNLCDLIGNKAKSGRYTLKTSYSSAEVKATNFKNNNAAIIHVITGKLIIDNNTVLNNSMQGSMFYAHKCSVKIEGTNFKNNIAKSQLIHVVFCNLIFNNSTLIGNIVENYGILE